MEEPSITIAPLGARQIAGLRWLIENQPMLEESHTAEVTDRWDSNIEIDGNRLHIRISGIDLVANQIRRGSAYVDEQLYGSLDALAERIETESDRISEDG